MKYYKVIIVGSGFGGQSAAVNLQKNGIDDFIILERRSFMGGTWCQNTYPGAAVDVQSLLYSLSFESYQWSRMFATQKELADYTHHVIEKYQLREKTKLNATVQSANWVAYEKRWQVKLENGEVYAAQFIINATGPLSTPKIPEFEGLNTFEGNYFHTNQWDHKFDYQNKKIAIIGSGASAIQVIPAIADTVKQLHIFQRTPHWVLPKPDFKFPSFIQNLLRFKPIYKAARYLTYWLLESRVIAFKYSEFARKLFAENKAKRFIKKSFSDPAFRKKVTPDFSIGCKRILLSNNLYPTYQKDNVSLHTKEQGIKKITRNGIETIDGQSLDLDLIIFATGFDAATSIVSYEVSGKNSKHLREFWEAYPRAYLGTVVPDFPNFFIITGPNTGIGHTSALFIIESQMNYILTAIQQVDRENHKSIEVKKDAEIEYTKLIHTEMEQTVWKSGGCKSWYQSKSGHVIAKFPGFSFNYYRLAKNFKKNHHTFE